MASVASMASLASLASMASTSVPVMIYAITCMMMSAIGAFADTKADDTNYFPCYHDLCKRGDQYCLDKEQRCKWCSYLDPTSNRSEIPRDCDSFFVRKAFEKDLANANEEIIEIKNQLDWEQQKNNNMTTETEQLQLTVNSLMRIKELDNRWIIVLGVGFVGLLLLSIFLTVCLCRLKRKDRGSSETSSVIKPEDVAVEERDRLVDDDVVIEMNNIPPPTDEPQLTTSDQSTSMTSLLQARDDQNQEGVASKPPGLSVENSGCQGPKDICIRSLPNELKQMPPRNTDSGKGLFS